MVQMNHKLIGDNPAGRPPSPAIAFEFRIPYSRSPATAFAFCILPPFFPCRQPYNLGVIGVPPDLKVRFTITLAQHLDPQVLPGK
jgi:hypothetical protein